MSLSSTTQPPQQLVLFSAPEPAPASQVYIQIHEGIATTYLFGPPVDVIEIDWDAYDEGGLRDFELGDLYDQRNRLAKIRDPELRTAALDEIDHLIVVWIRDYQEAYV